MKKSLIGIIGFGLFLAYCLVLLYLGENPGGKLIISIVGLLISIGNYVTTDNHP